MKPIIQIISAFVLIFSLGSCSDRAKMLALNKDLVTINNTLRAKGIEAGDEVKTGVATGNFSGLKTKRLELESYVATQLERVKKMEDAGGSEAMRHKEIEYLEFEQQLIRTHFRTIENFNSNTTEEEAQATFQEVMAAGKREDEILLEFKELLNAWAAKNNIILK